MAYRWTEDGPAFEFPTPYRVENKMLAWRGGALLGVAVLIIGVTVLLSGSDAANAPVAIEDRADPISSWKLYLLALVLMALAVLDIVRQMRQRTLRLARGQPASLAQLVPHEATGVGAGAPLLMQALLRGELPAAPLEGPYQRLLRGLGDLTLAPQPLRLFLAARVAHLTLGLGLLLVFAAGAVVLMKKPVALPALALVLSLLGAAFVARQAVLSAEPPLGKYTLLATLAVAALALVPLYMFAPQLAVLEPLRKFGLPAAVAVALCSGLLFELIGLLAGRAQLRRTRPERLAREEALIDFGADPRNLVQEIDRELYRRWTEGVPNRRYAWQPPFVDRAAQAGDFGAKVLEESQPMMQVPREATKAAGAAMNHPPPPGSKAEKAAKAAQAAKAAAEAPATPGVGLLKVLAACGFAWGLAGALLWLWLAYSLLNNPASPLWPGAVGLACLAGAGYALRIGHVLWSRIELQSTLTWIELKGGFVRVPGAAAPAPERPGLQRPDRPVRSDEVTVQVLVAKARSVFYAAAEPGPLGRTLLGWQADRAAADFWIGFVEAFARGDARGDARGGDAATGTAPRVKARPVRPAAGLAAPTEPEAATPSRRPARFCSNCGSPVLAGARFCQQCGNVLASD